MLQWVNENDVIKKVFRHYQVLRQGSKIIQFVAKEKGLDKDFLSYMWEYTDPSDESMQVSVFNLVIDLLELVPSEQIDFFYEKISLLPSAAYKSQVLTFIGDFTKKAIKVRSDRKQEERLYGLEIFWNLLVRTPGAGQDRTTNAVISETIEHLEKLLGKYPSQRELFLGKCLEKLRNGEIVETSLNLLKRMLKSFDSHEIGPAIVQLDKNEKVVDSVLAELERCQKDAEAKSLKALLEFLEFILTQSELVISVEQANRLWDSVTKTDHPDRNHVYQWFETVQHSYLESNPYGDQVSKFPAFSPAVTESLFNKMTCLDHNSLSADGFRMYRRFFLGVNARKKKLRRLGEDSFRVCDFDLIGLEMFWNIGISSKETNVALLALSYLRKIYENVSLKLQDRVSEERKKFILTCMSYILSAKDILRSDSSSEEKDSARERASRSVSLLISILMKDNRSRPSEEIHELRTKEAIWKANPPSAEEETMEEAMSALKESDKEEAPPPLNYVRPGDTIGQQYFDALFEFLPVTEMRDRIWELIMLLPTDKAIYEAVNSLPKDGDTPLFVKQISSAPEDQFIFRLLYLLQVTRYHLLDDEWVGNFIDAGGLNYLVDIFSNRDLLTEKNGEYGKQTMSHLVDAMNQLFSSGKVDHDKLINCLSGNFVLRLMEQISELAVRRPQLKTQQVEVLKIEEPETNPSVKKGTRIANCHYHNVPCLLSFEITGGHYQVACYCVDYNTDRRAQTMVPWLGTDKSVAELIEGKHPHGVNLVGSDFHNGQWVVWDVHGEGKFNISISNDKGPNWVFSALLIDKSPKGAAPASVHPSLVCVDNETHGKWRGKYGSLGGVLLGRQDFIVPPLPGSPPNAPRLLNYDTDHCEKYEWIQELTSDNRGMQMAPNYEDEAESSVDDETELLPLPPLKDAPRLNVGGENTNRSTETSRSLLALLVASSLDRADLLKAVVDYPALKDWLFTCLIQCNDQRLRESVVEGIESLCSKADCGNFFLEKLLEFLPQMENEMSSLKDSKDRMDPALAKNFTEYFFLVLSLLKKTGGSSRKDILQQVYKMLQAHQTLEDDEKSSVDTTLVGFLDLIAFFFEGHLEFLQDFNIIQDIFHDGLFGVQESRSAPKIPKCRTRASRDAAFKVLLVASKETQGVHREVIELLINQLGKSTLPEDWNIDVFEQTTEERTQRKNYVGLKNQGCTCYLNSLVQQLFIIPSLRNDIMSVTVEKKKDSIMYQLQSLFAYMQESNQKYVDTIDFCRTVKMMGQPIVMSRQEDANEFFNSLADQVEPYLKGTRQESLFKDTFGGNLLSQIISLECPHQSNTPQDFLTISLKVLSKRDIYESLDFYVQADMLDGDNKWKCEECNRHVAAKKRSCIQHLPNTLALHLIRFEFDYQTFQEVKVNDRFEFPQQINMKPYTKEGIMEADGEEVDPELIRPDDYYMYDLVGVLIHSGTAHSGHYYSYIRERVSADGSGPKWFEFNDREVTEFRPDSLQNQAYGGKFSEGYKSEKSFSAYMLFYERANTYPAGKYESKPLHEGSVALDVSQEKSVEPAILDTIWKDGVVNFHQKLMMTASTFRFIWDVVSLLPPFEPVKEYSSSNVDLNDFTVKTLYFATKFTMDVLSHCANSLDVVKKIEHLSSLYKNHAPMAGWLLDQMAHPENSWMKNTLLHCPDSDIRVAAAELMCQCIHVIAPVEESYYLEMEEVQPGDVVVVEDEKSDDKKGKEEATEGDDANEKKPANPPMRPRSVVVRFINRLTALVTAAADKPSHKIEQMLYVLLQFAKVGPRERQILMNKNAVTDLIALFDSHRYSGTGNQPSNTRFVHLIELLAALVIGCDNPARIEHQGGTCQPTGMKLGEASLKKLFERAFLNSVLRQLHLTDLMLPIFVHWVWGQPDYSDAVVRSMCHVMDSLYNASAREVIVNLLFTLFSLNDPVCDARITLGITLVVDLVRINFRLENFRAAFVMLVFEIARNFPVAREWLITQKNFHDLVSKYPEIEKAVMAHKEEYEKIIAERRERFPPDEESPEKHPAEELKESDGDEEIAQLPEHLAEKVAAAMGTPAAASGKLNLSDGDTPGSAGDKGDDRPSSHSSVALLD